MIRPPTKIVACTESSPPEPIPGFVLAVAAVVRSVLTWWTWDLRGTPRLGSVEDPVASPEGDVTFFFFFREFLFNEKKGYIGGYYLVVELMVGPSRL